MGKKKYLFLIAIVAFVVAVSGCTSSSDTTSTNDSASNDSNVSTTTSTSSSSSTSSNVILKITSDGSWSGSIQDDSGGRSVDGTGNEEFDLGANPGIVSATIQKQGTSGTLTVELIKDGKAVKSQTTNAEYGVVSVSDSFF